MIQEYLKRMLRQFSLIKSSDESLSIQQDKVKLFYEKFLQFYAAEVKALEKEKFKNRLELWSGTERREVQMFKIVAELNEYDNQNIFIRFWWRITNRIQDVDAKRAWLASLICQHLTENKDTLDFAQQQVIHQELFPYRWKSILTQLKSAAIYFKSLLPGNAQRPVIIDDSDDKIMLNEENNEIISPSNTSLVLVSSGSNDTSPLLDPEKTETDQLTLDQLYKLFYVCGFLNLILEGVTPSQIKSRLNKLKLEVHPDKLPREYTDKDGNSFPYSEEALKSYQEMMATCFEIVQNKMPPLPKHIDSPLLPTKLLSQLQIDDVYSSGKEQGQIFHAFIQFAKSEAETNTRFDDFLLSVAQLENKMKNNIKNADKYIQNADKHINNLDNYINTASSYINNASSYINNASVYIENIKEYVAETEQATQELNQIEKKVKAMKDKFNKGASSETKENPSSTVSSALSENSPIILSSNATAQPENEVKGSKEKLHRDSTSKIKEENDIAHSTALSRNSITERASNILIYKKLSEAACNNNPQAINTSLDESNKTDASALFTNAQPTILGQDETITCLKVLAENGEQPPPRIDDVSQDKHLTFQ